MAAEILKTLMGLRDLLVGRSPTELLLKGHRMLQRDGLAGLSRLFRDLLGLGGYRDWIRLYDTLTERDRLLIDRHIKTFVHQPLISVVMPVFDPPAEFLLKAIESVRKQRYPHWELCIADDASTRREVREILTHAETMDARIRVSYRQNNGHISAASNTALEMAQGDFVALLDHDDELSEHALYLVAAALNENPKLDLLYSDEDRIDRHGRRFGYYFKPNWNPDLFLSQNLISHLGVYRRSIAQEIGGFRVGYEGSQDWDFALRFIEATRPECIHHLPFILYHWRAIPGSTAVSTDAKDYVVRSAQRALEDSWKRKGISAQVTVVEAGQFTTLLPLPQPPPLVSVVICTHNNLESLRRCYENLIQRTDYPALEILVVDYCSNDPATLAYLEQLQEQRSIKLLRHVAPFNISRLNNLAAKEAKGKLLCLIDTGIEPIQAGWLRHMVAHALRPEIAAVGATLLSSDGTVQYRGILLEEIATKHVQSSYSWRSFAPVPGNRARLAQNFSAISAACLVVRKSVWDEVGGMDETFAHTFNDVDFCLRLRTQGYRHLWLPQAKLYLHEPAILDKVDTPEKKGILVNEFNILQDRWRQLIDNDPAWSPNLAINGTRIDLASPPKRINPWISFDF